MVGVDAFLGGDDGLLELLVLYVLYSLFDGGGSRVEFAQLHRQFLVIVPVLLVWSHRGAPKWLQGHSVASFVMSKWTQLNFPAMMTLHHSTESCLDWHQVLCFWCSLGCFCYYSFLVDFKNCGPMDQSRRLRRLFTRIFLSPVHAVVPHSWQRCLQTSGITGRLMDQQQRRFLRIGNPIEQSAPSGHWRFQIMRIRRQRLDGWCLHGASLGLQSRPRWWRCRPIELLLPWDIMYSVLLSQQFLLILRIHMYGHLDFIHHRIQLPLMLIPQILPLHLVSFDLGYLISITLQVFSLCIIQTQLVFWHFFIFYEFQNLAILAGGEDWVDVAWELWPHSWLNCKWCLTSGWCPWLILDRSWSHWLFLGFGGGLFGWELSVFIVCCLCCQWEEVLSCWRGRCFGTCVPFVYAAGRVEHILLVDTILDEPLRAKVIIMSFERRWYWRDGFIDFDEHLPWFAFWL